MKKIISFILTLVIVISAMSVILVAEAVPAPPAKNADGSITYADGKVYANDPNILFTGRWEQGEHDVYFSGWQSCIEVKFTQTTTLKLMLTTKAVVDIFDEKGNSILPVAKPELDEVGRRTNGLDLTFGKITLDAKKTYTVRLISYWSEEQAVFQGLCMDAGAKTLPIADAPYIEFIGDSITEGYVNEKYTLNGGNSWTDSFSYRTAVKLGWHASAVGKCATAIVRPGHEHIDTKYELFMDTNSTKKHDFSKQNLDYIVVNMGTNDGAYLRENTNAKEEFKEGYKAFIQGLLQKHPNATIFVMEPFCNVISYSGGNEIKAVADELDRVEFIKTATWNLTQDSAKKDEYLADGVHPLPAGADYAAEKLAAVLKEFHEKGKMPNEATPTPTPTVKPTEKPIATATNKPEATNKPNATKAPAVTEIPEIHQENKSDLTWLWISVGAVALAGCVVAAVIIIKKKKSAKQ